MWPVEAGSGLLADLAGVGRSVSNRFRGPSAVGDLENVEKISNHPDDEGVA